MFQFSHIAREFFRTTREAMKALRAGSSTTGRTVRMSILIIIGTLAEACILILLKATIETAYILSTLD